MNKENNIDIQNELDKLKQDYLDKLPAKLQLIHDIWQKLNHYSWNDDAFFSLYRLVHSLAGSGKTFGLTHLSDHAKQFENYVCAIAEDKQIPTYRQRRHIESLIYKITEAAKQPANNIEVNISAIENQTVCPLSETKTQSTIYVIDDDRHMCLYLNTLLSNAGYNVRTFENPALAINYIEKCEPDLVIIDIVFPSSVSITSFDAADEFRSKTGKRVPLIYISSRTDLAARTKAIRSGGDAYFTKPIQFTVLLEKIKELINEEFQESLRVLIVDDDVELSRYHALLLKNSDMDYKIVNNPVEIIKSLEDYHPDLLLMDWHMPRYSGLELLSVIRQDPNYVGLPIVFLSAETKPDMQDKAYELGINEFLSKPVTQDILINTIRKQVRLSKKIRGQINKLAKYDSRNGMHNRHYFMEQLDTAVSSAGDNKKRFRVLIDININNADTLKEKFGIEWIDPVDQQISALMQSLLGREDIATHFSDANYFILTQYANSDQHINFTVNLRNRLSAQKIRYGSENIQLHASVNIIRISQSITSTHELLRFAEKLSIATEHEQSDKITIHMLSPKHSGTCEATRDKIIHAIENKSFQLAFQPIISVAHKRYETYEVLVRFVDTEGKLILPSQFMPYIKDKNDLLEIDRWVVEHAISTLSEDKHARAVTDLFVKLSAVTLCDTRLIPHISNSLTEGGITGSTRIIFHVSEKDLSSNLEQAIKFVENIKKLNCGFSIDHFGTTENHETLLKTFHPDYVKLRGGVFKNILEDSSVVKHIHNLIEQAKQYQCEVIAASIEDPATLSMLWNMGIRYFQGYFIKEPDKLLDFNFLEAAV